MALERASSKGIIQWKVDVDSKIIQQHPCLDMHCHFAHREIFHRALEDSTNRFLIPSIERNLRFCHLLAFNLTNLSHRQFTGPSVSLVLFIFFL